MLGPEPTKQGVGLDSSAPPRMCEKLSQGDWTRVAPERLVADLSVGEAQRVEILKTLFRGAKILVLDEPTAVLSPPEVRELWTVLRRLRDAGDTIVLITHRLDEVIELSDTITVMRAGQTVARIETPGRHRPESRERWWGATSRSPRADAYSQSTPCRIRPARGSRCAISPSPDTRRS